MKYKIVEQEYIIGDEKYEPSSKSTITGRDSS
jgi:hypothetical protein